MAGMHTLLLILYYGRSGRKGGRRKRRRSEKFLSTLLQPAENLEGSTGLKLYVCTHTVFKRNIVLKDVLGLSFFKLFIHPAGLSILRTKRRQSAKFS